MRQRARKVVYGVDRVTTYKSNYICLTNCWIRGWDVDSLRVTREVFIVICQYKEVSTYSARRPTRGLAVDPQHQPNYGKDGYLS